MVMGLENLSLWQRLNSFSAIRAGKNKNGVKIRENSIELYTWTLHIKFTILRYIQGYPQWLKLKEDLSLFNFEDSKVELSCLPKRKSFWGIFSWFGKERNKFSAPGNHEYSLQLQEIMNIVYSSRESWIQFTAPGNHEYSFQLQGIMHIRNISLNLCELCVTLIDRITEVEYLKK